MTVEYNGKPLEDCSVEELEQFKLSVGKNLEAIASKENRNALKDIVKIAKNNKLSVIDVIKVLKDSHALNLSLDAKGNPRPIYYNPECPLELYSGWGRKPAWLMQLEESGADIEKYKFEVK